MAFPMFSAQTSPIAVDFGSSSVKLLQTSSDNEPSIVAAAEVPVPDELRQSQEQLLAFYATEIPRVIRQGKFKGKRVVSAVPSRHTFVQHMQVPASEGVPMEDLVKTELQMQMGCTPSNLVVRSIEVADVHREGQVRRETICFAASRDTVMRHVELLKRCKLEPVGMHTETMAMVRAFDHLSRRAEDSAVTTLFVDLGWAGTRVAICHGRQIRFARFIQVGGRNFDQLIASSLNCDTESARSHRLEVNSSVPQPPEAPKLDKDLPEGMAVFRSAMARAAATSKDPSSMATAERRVGAVPAELRYSLSEDAPPGETVGVDVSEMLETVTDELSMCLRYHRAIFPQRRLDRVIFLGGEARQMWLCQHLVRSLRVPAQLGDPLARLNQDRSTTLTGVALEEPQPGWAVACGLCKAPTDL
ncbi:MAG: pilus assembly protein PilM [Planctomycetota bacterium]